MILIFGGAYQGKLAFVQEQFGVTHEDCCDCGEENPDLSRRVLYHFDRLLLRLVEQEQNPTDYLRVHLEEWQDKIILVTDISAGVVPMDPVLRRWREETGRCMVLLAQNAQTVIRVYCGIPTQLK